MIADRDRAIRAQQQCISKLKQSLVEVTETGSGDDSLLLLDSQTKTDSSSPAHIKRLLLQYLTSCDEECMQLLPTVSSALHLSDEEEREVWASLRSKLHIS
ncbi:unnamed protein product [Gongylonema pulchrum]|uniref:GRIP domain-containing protein n=1 Tax=Gongylonema pulchrum TaxID=637853 RepID=A0A183D5G1_9BILA|nr:unnamed protein product [Gongylonema pulchrum]